ncbi:unnamed protein product [Soboliphyme baturini]|uniref:ABC transporter domain-containing protein n=1 Tax=Soboliphyme baturini TaxID=241478 RepID=A0A183IGS5_9BILA|nr:unnamed protein product [Soboliphyme baturini]
MLLPRRLLLLFAATAKCRSPSTSSRLHVVLRRLLNSRLTPRNGLHAGAAVRGLALSKPKLNEIRKLLSLAVPERYSIGAAICLIAVSSSVSLSVPYFMGRIIDMIFAGDDVHSVDPHSTTSTAAVLSADQQKRARIVNRLREKVFNSIMSQEIAFFDRTKSGELINRLSNDVSSVGYATTVNISDGLRGVVAAVGGTTMMARNFCVSTKLALVGISVVPPVAAVAVMYGRYLKRLSQGTLDALAAANEVAAEKISNIRTVRAFNGETFEGKRYAARLKEVLTFSYKDGFANGLFFAFNGLSANILMVVILYTGSGLVCTGEITIGALSSFLFYAVFVGVSLSGITSFYTELMRGIGATARLFELTDRRPAAVCAEGVRPPALYGTVVFKNVSFAYPTRKAVPAVNNINLVLNPGSVVAVVGPSGSGKSTIAHLLLRLYDPDEGDIYIDDLNLKQLDPRWIRDQVGAVIQDVVLFSSSVAENISYPYRIADQALLEAAADRASALDFISQLPNGFDTLVGEKGVLLSDIGERQRIAIARALLKNAPILLLDEATSALDAQSEHIVKLALKRLMFHTFGKTVLIIAHRLSTVKQANEIVVLNQGRIVERGTFQELTSIENGLFTNLVQKQSLTG